MTTKTPTPKYLNSKQKSRMIRETRNKRWLTFGIVVVAALVFGLIAYGVVNEYVLKQNRAVARVDNKAITLSDYESQVRFRRYNYVQNSVQTYQFAQAYGLDISFYQSYLTEIQSILTDSQTLASNVLDELIDNIITEKEANKLGITVSDAEVNKRMEEFFRFYADGTPTPTVTVTPFATSTMNPLQLTLTAPTSTPTLEPTEAGLTATATLEPTSIPPTATAEPTSTPDLTATAAPTATEAYTATPEPTITPYTYDGYTKLMKDYLTSISDLNFTRPDLNNLLKAQIYHERMLEEVTKDLKPEQDQVWARHILVATEDEARAVMERINKGEEWCNLAAELSTDTSNNSKCGDLGWFGPGEMVTEFEVAAYSLPAGEISQPIPTKFGWHLIQVLGHEIRPLSQSEFEQLKQDNFDQWLVQKRADYKIEKFDLIWQENIPLEPTLPPELLQQ